MTLEELMAREQIRDTIAAVSHAGDGLDLDEYVAAYTEDGILQFRDFVNQGREAIRKWIGRGIRAREKNPTHFVRHSVTSTRIKLVAADRAEVYSYYHVYSHAGPDHFGDYRDVFEQCGDRWLIKHRIVGLDWVSPQSPHAPRQS
jgi:hypothetical protein